jgi:protein-tyrosine-phosphatase/DNA-binding transcriptional ArsR family regulator
MDSGQAAAAFSALAQETRVRLLRLLATAGATGMAAGDLGARLQVPSSTLSFHLAALEQAGLVQSTRRGRQVIYAVRILGLRNLLAFMTETCCGGRPELCGDLARLLPDLAEEEPAMTAAFNVLFLCTRNSARSIMAEAILAQVGHGRFRAYSAGSSPAKAPLPVVLEKLRALGHDVSRLRSKSWNEFTRPDAPRLDFVIALCDTPRGQQCPDFGDLAVTAAWPLPDPARFTGSPVEYQALLGELYRGIRRRLELFCSLPLDKLDRMAVKARLDEIAGGQAVLA